MEKSLYEIKCDIDALWFVHHELEKIEKKLHKQIEKGSDDLEQSEKIYLYFPIKYCGGNTEDYPIHNEQDLLELWQNDYITNQRTYEKYENKLRKLMGAEEKETKISQSRNNVRMVEKFKENVALEIKDLKIRYNRCKEEE